MRPLLVVVIGGALLVGCGAAEREPAQRPESGSVEVTVALSAATPAKPCPAREQGAIPAAGSLAGLGVLERAPTAADALPEEPGSSDYSWLPATTTLPTEARLVGPGRSLTEIHLVPTLGVRTDGRCDADSSRNNGPGVCLTAGTGRGVSVRCFTDEAIWNGRAVALTGNYDGRPAGQLHGIVPDGVQHVRVSWTGGSEIAPAVGNVYQAHLPGVGEGARVTLTFVAPGQPKPCEPSPALLRTVPALRAEAPLDPPPAQLAAVVGVEPRLVERWARIWSSDDGLTYWVVPELRCGVVTANDRACVAVAADFIEGAACAAEADIAQRGVSDWYPIDGRPVLAGLAPRAATIARVSVPGYEQQLFPVRDGVFAGTLPEDVRMDRPDTYNLTFIR